VHKCSRCGLWISQVHPEKAFARLLRQPCVLEEARWEDLWQEKLHPSHNMCRTVAIWACKACAFKQRPAHTKLAAGLQRPCKGLQRVAAITRREPSLRHLQESAHATSVFSAFRQIKKSQEAKAGEVERPPAEAASVPAPCTGLPHPNNKPRRQKVKSKSSSIASYFQPSDSSV
jgi:hypothetical protein